MDPSNKSVLEQIQDPYVENRYNMTSTSAQYPTPKHGGWVPNIGDAKETPPYLLYHQAKPIFGENNRCELVGNIHTSTPLNDIFFSSSNIDTIQSEIQNQVYLMSGNKYRIGRQDDDKVKIIMRSYYLMFSKNDPNLVGQELEELNRRVIGYCSAKVYSEVDFHMFYLKDIEDFAPPIANPTNTQVFGTRTGELKSFF